MYVGSFGGGAWRLVMLRIDAVVYGSSWNVMGYLFLVLASLYMFGHRLWSFVDKLLGSRARVYWCSCLRYHRSQLLDSLRLPFFGSCRGRAALEFASSCGLWTWRLRDGTVRKVSISQEPCRSLDSGGCAASLVAFAGPLSSVPGCFYGFLWPDVLLMV